MKQKIFIVILLFAGLKSPAQQAKHFEVQDLTSESITLRIYDREHFGKTLMYFQSENDFQSKYGNIQGVNSISRDATSQCFLVTMSRDMATKLMQTHFNFKEEELLNLFSTDSKENMKKNSSTNKH